MTIDELVTKRDQTQSEVENLKNQLLTATGGLIILNQLIEDEEKKSASES
jgi:hypothetical protein